MPMFDTGGTVIRKTRHNELPASIKHYAAYFVLLAFCTLMFVPLISSLSVIGGDYKLHLQWAEEIEKSHIINLPHPLYHVLVILAKSILSINYAESSTIVVVASIFFLAVLNYRILIANASPSIATILSLSLLIVTPIQLFYFIDHHLYLGYIGISIYHSPTMLLLKPLSLLVFCYALRSADGPAYEWPIGVALALSLFFCGISKPNFLIVVLPAFLAFLFITNRLRILLSRAHIYIWFFLPILAVLGLQFFQTFILQDISKVTKDAENHIVFMPLETVSHYSEFLLPKLVLSVAFPLVTLLLYTREFAKDDRLIFSSCCLIMGSAFMYLFAESGSRIYHGNFWWSAQIGLYLTFIFSIDFLIRNYKEFTNNTPRAIKYFACFVVFFLHLGFGFFYYKQELVNYSKFW